MTSFPPYGPGGAPQPQPAQQPGAGFRASDADREGVVAVLHDAVMRGLLTLDEGNDRVTAAYAARYVQDLPALTADLPPAPPSAPVAPGWRALAALAWLQLRTALAGLSWRGALSRPRLVLAVVGLLAVLTLAATSVSDFGNHGPMVHPHFQHADRFGPP